MVWVDYVKIRKIGEGAFGKAWLVQDFKIDKLFVIKEVKISRMNDKDKNSAITEVAILSKLNHSNIVSYIDSFVENGCLGMVMEYCEGGDLFSKIMEHKEKGILFSEEQIIDWFYQLASALNYIHERKILHRDLKSQNIFLKNGCVKLGDFGIAKVLRNTLELAKTCIGTPVAFSPEIVQGEPYNHKSDIWSLGCVLYELTMLKLPFQSDNINELFCKILRVNFEPIKYPYSKELIEINTKMLRRAPDRRPNTDEILNLRLFYKDQKNFMEVKQLRFNNKRPSISNIKSRNESIDKNNQKNKNSRFVTRELSANGFLKKPISRQATEDKVSRVPRSSSYHVHNHVDYNFKLDRENKKILDNRCNQKNFLINKNLNKKPPSPLQKIKHEILGKENLEIEFNEKLRVQRGRSQFRK